MRAVRDLLVALLFFLPILTGWVLLFKLSAYRRDGRGFAGTFLTPNYRVLRPDLYTDDGQRLLRWAWALLVVTIPWCVVVAFLFT